MTFIDKHEAAMLQPPERLPVGHIEVLSDSDVRDADGRKFHRRRVAIGDESDPTIRQKFHEKADLFERMLEQHPEWEATKLTDEGELVVDPNNIPARDLYYDEHGRETQMFEWGHQMQQAIALEGLQKLGKGGRFLELGRLDRRTLELFTNMPDGIGLRSRQRIYTGLLVEEARQVPQDTLTIVSLGSGAAVPNIDATERVESEVGKKIDWHFYDIDPTALRNAQMLAREASINGSTFDFGPESEAGAEEPFVGRSYLEARNLPNESVDVVDALGLWEYLTPKQAAFFLKIMYTKLKPGAPMIVSNMLASRPHGAYNQRAVGWPDVKMRNEDDLLDIVQLAEIDTECVTFTHSQDGVYVVMEIRKQWS